jgi:hypothetical protein
VLGLRGFSKGFTREGFKGFLGLKGVREPQGFTKGFKGVN